MTGPIGYPTPPSPEPKKRPGWMVGGVTIVSFVVLLWVIELFDSLSNHRLDNNGIRPLETDGMMGIVFAPLLHANWDHLIANTVPALILGFLMTLAGLSRFIFATAIWNPPSMSASVFAASLPEMSITASSSCLAV